MHLILDDPVFCRIVPPCPSCGTHLVLHSILNVTQGAFFFDQELFGGVSLSAESDRRLLASGLRQLLKKVLVSKLPNQNFGFRIKNCPRICFRGQSLFVYFVLFSSFFFCSSNSSFVRTPSSISSFSFFSSSAIISPASSAFASALASSLTAAFVFSETYCFFF